MCDPFTATVVSLAGSAAAAGLSYSQQQATMSAQKNANDDWVNYQREQARTAAERDEERRKEAAAAHGETMAGIDPANQKKIVGEETTRLNDEYTKGGPASDPNVAVLGDEGTAGGSAEVKKGMGDQVTGAVQEARKRIKALAAMSAYGSSSEGLGRNAADAFATGNQAIGLTSNIRKGNAQTLGVAQRVPIANISSGSNIGGSIASGLANIAGSAGGSWLKGAGTDIGVPAGNPATGRLW